MVMSLKDNVCTWEVSWAFRPAVRSIAVDRTRERVRWVMSIGRSAKVTDRGIWIYGDPATSSHMSHRIQSH
jgi:hypothetical protein